MGAALPWIMLGTSVAGGLTQAQGAQQQGAAAAAQNQYLAQVAANNQIIAEQNAEQAEQRGGRLAEMKELETAGRLGAVTAAAGASGLDTTSGSPLRLAADTKAMGELDARMIRYNASREAYGYRTQGVGYAAQAQLDEMAGSNALRAGQLEAIGSVIGAGANVADKWAKYKMAGVGTA